MRPAGNSEFQRESCSFEALFRPEDDGRHKRPKSIAASSSSFGERTAPGLRRVNMTKVNMARFPFNSRHRENSSLLLSQIVECEHWYAYLFSHIFVFGFLIVIRNSSLGRLRTSQILLSRVETFPYLDEHGALNLLSGVTGSRP